MSWRTRKLSGGYENQDKVTEKDKSVICKDRVSDEDAKEENSA